MQNKRIVWIDWAKAIGIMIVVFCHIPQYDTLEKHFLFLTQMPLFFMLSGYLHKSPDTLSLSLHKYWKTLLIPYLLFQVIFIPYFLIRENFDGMNLMDVHISLILPIIKCLIGIPLDGPTWFIYALFIVKIIADLLQKSKHNKIYVLVVCVISVVVSYILYSDNIININFAIDSMFNFMPFFFVGYYLKQRDICNFKASVGISKDLLYVIVLLLMSLIIIVYHPQGYFYDRLVFYIVGITGSLVIIYLSKCFKKNLVINTISLGTIIILGMHWMFIGTINVVFEKLLRIGHGILYTSFQTILLVLFITFVNYYIIIFCKRYFDMLLGGRK